MQHQIKYTPDNDAMFLGRNGAFGQHGIRITSLDNHKCVLVEPVRKNGEAGRCGMDIPFDALPAVIAALQDIAALHAPAKAVGHLGTVIENLPSMSAEQEVDGSKDFECLEVGEQYDTRDGRIVQINVYNPHAKAWQYHGHYVGTGGLDCWNADGSSLAVHLQPNDLVRKHKKPSEEV